ncbi:MAG: hypothetical protein Tp176DCM1853251_15 [Prokaryotic dsDNA virus sp.]|nr:MAG: hypothetical protein Tp176DCM1853251_15 [Prokaryotic dsDNA virus sp.]|tara:strand:- start:1533 stop:2168 length:636 start_codon:yes stop_codon:yes gene_type:complete
MIEWTDWHEKHSEKILLIPGVDCWIWIAGRTAGKSHGRVRYNRGERHYSEYSHRAAFIEAKGEIPDGCIICHACGVGLCVRPSHLYAGSFKDNGRDMATMKTFPKSLSDASVLEIRTMYRDGAKLSDISKRYGIAFGTVYPIVTGKSYRYAPFPDGLVTGERARKPLTKEEVSGIREMLDRGETQTVISQKYNIAQSIVSRIKTGTRHANR